jgi:hypothetical protein
MNLYKEGDIWIEKGKTWTVKNGIKRTVSVKDNLRKSLHTPLACPKCSKSMNHYLDEKMWTLHKLCFNCTIDKEHQIITAGKWQEYEKAKITANAEAFLKDLTDYVGEFVQDNTTKAHVTEDGIIERWKEVNKDRLHEIGNTVIEDITDKVTNYKNKE